MNFTLTVPEGTTNHGNSKLLCTPAQWYDFVIFFFGNYFAHAATVVPVPGQGFESTAISIFLALTLPGSAIVRAVTAIVRHAATERRNPLRRAARAGALCIVLPAWKKPSADEIPPVVTPRDLPTQSPAQVAPSESNGDGVEVSHQGHAKGQQISATAPLALQGERSARDVDLERGEPNADNERDITRAPASPWWNPPRGYRAVLPDSQIHGEYWLHEDYYLAIVPFTAMLHLESDPGAETAGLLVESDPEFKHSNPHLSSSHNRLKLSISLVQAIWATITIYRARGDQV
ncbi:hypothetical protein N656DRAFT_695023, partial [Canariomyces notabilis]